MKYCLVVYENTYIRESNIAIHWNGSIVLDRYQDCIKDEIVWFNSKEEAILCYKENFESPTEELQEILSEEDWIIRDIIK